MQVVIAAIKVLAVMESGHHLSAIVIECINEVIDPLGDETNTDQTQEEMEDLRERKSVLLKDEKYVEVAQVDSRLKELEQLEHLREQRWIHAMSVAAELLQHVSKLDGSLHGEIKK